MPLLKFTLPNFRPMPRHQWLKFAQLFLLFNLILWPRLWPFPVGFVTHDEMLVSGFVNQMTTALFNGDLAHVTNRDYPAITLMWLEAASLSFTQLAPPPEADLSLTFSHLPRRRFTLALVNSGLIMGMFFLLKRLSSTQTALLMTMLIALDPFALTQWRVYRVEGLNTSLMTVSMLALLVYLKTAQLKWLGLSGLLGGLATLTKITSLYLLPYLILTLTIGTWWSQSRSIKKWGQAVGLWFAIWLITIFSLWPALWVAPWATLHGNYDYLRNANSQIANWGKYGALFFNGQVLYQTDPGPSFYFFTLAYRISPFVGVGLALLVFHLAKQRLKAHHLPILLLTAYILFFFIAMCLVKSKVDRYLHPIFPPLAILAAWGYQRSLNRYGTLILTTLAIILLWPYQPYYFNYWNPLLGGGRTALQHVPVGSEEGIEQTMAYLNRLPQPTHLTVAGAGVFNCLAFVGKCVTANKFMDSDYFLVDIFFLQRGLYRDSLAAIMPESELVQLYEHDQIPYSRLYKTPPVFKQMKFRTQWLGAHGRLMGYGADVATTATDTPLNLYLFWQNGDKGWTLDTSEFFIQFIDETQQVRYLTPLSTTTPLESTQPNQLLLFKTTITLPQELPLSHYELKAAMRLKDSHEVTWQFDPTTHLRIDHVPISTNPAIWATAQHPLEADLNAPLALLGYSLSGQLQRQTLTIRLYWRNQTMQPTLADLKIINQTNQLLMSQPLTILPQAISFNEYTFNLTAPPATLTLSSTLLTSPITLPVKDVVLQN